MSKYRIIITTNPKRTARGVYEHGFRFLWSVHLPEQDSDTMPSIARGSTDTRWGARREARRAIKEYEFTPKRAVSEKPIVVSDTWVQT